MSSLLAEAGEVFASFFTNDAWTIRTALRTQGAWLAGLIFTLVGGLGVLFVYRVSPL